MRRDDVISTLQSLEPELKAQGVSALYLFGSVARDEATPSSDVDVAFDVRPDAQFDLFDQARISVDLAEALGASVDFVERDCLQPIVAEHAADDLVRVF